jgi:hypothetical protein
MAYEFHISEEYCVEAGWFYCASIGIAYDKDRFEHDVQASPEEPPESAILRLISPHLARVGFPEGSYGIEQITDDYVEFEGFALTYGDFYIFFNDDAIRRVIENYPASITYEFSNATKQMLTVLRSDRFESVTLLKMARLDQNEGGH